MEHYRKLFRYQLDPGLIDKIRKATNGNFALGNDLFKAQITTAISCRAFRGTPGRAKAS